MQPRISSIAHEVKLQFSSISLREKKKIVKLVKKEKSYQLVTGKKKLSNNHEIKQILVYCLWIKTVSLIKLLQKNPRQFHKSITEKKICEFRQTILRKVTNFVKESQ